MKMSGRKTLWSFLMAAVLLMTTMFAAIPAAAAEETSEHEPITIMDAQRDYSALIELVHEKYPEINIEIIPYYGRNATAYMKHQLEVGRMPDIYSTTQPWTAELQKEHLLDLSEYAVTEMYNPVRLNEYDMDGAIYLLPYDYAIFGILCNQSLLERNNIAIPTSFAQMRDETIPALKAAGIEVSTCMMDLPGYPFQFFFNVANTGIVNTLEGRAWQNDFLAGKQTASEFLQSSKEYFQQWIDCGLINATNSDMSISARRAYFKEGHTAFWVGTSYFFSQNGEETGDQYCLIPYLSENGDQNIYPTQENRFYGLNAQLKEPGNEQKLEDALHVLEVMSTLEGFTAILGENTTNIASMRSFELPENSPYASVVAEINRGYCAPLIYNGWEDYIVAFGEAVIDWINGEITGDEALAVLDAQQTQIMTHGPTVYAVVTEELDTAQAAQLSGQIFMDATGADAALISYNVYYEGVNASQENRYGANGRILEGKLTEEYITTFLPTGWYDTLKTSSITGAVIKQMAKDGCDLRGNNLPYPYVLLTKDGQELADDQTYTVFVCGYAKNMAEILNLQDTGIVGLDAAKEYLLKVGEVSTATLDNSLVQVVE